MYLYDNDYLVSPCIDACTREARAELLIIYHLSLTLSLHCCLLLPHQSVASFPWKLRASVLFSFLLVATTTVFAADPCCQPQETATTTTTATKKTRWSHPFYHVCRYAAILWKILPKAPSPPSPPYQGEWERRFRYHRHRSHSPTPRLDHRNGRQENGIGHNYHKNQTPEDTSFCPQQETCRRC